MPIMKLSDLAVWPGALFYTIRWKDKERDLLGFHHRAGMLSETFTLNVGIEVINHEVIL